jgi:hypothetical protein
MSEPKPHQYTAAEVRTQFLDHLALITGHWLEDEQAPTVEEKMTGLVFSILAVIDGSSLELPAFVLAPLPHPDDEKLNRMEGENWYPSGVPLHDIAGSLHDHWPTVCRRAGLG